MVELEENDAVAACRTTPRSPWIVPWLPRLPDWICTSPELAMRPLFWRLLASSCTWPLPISVPPWVKVPPILPWNKPPAEIEPPVLSASCSILNWAISVPAVIEPWRLLRDRASRARLFAVVIEPSWLVRVPWTAYWLSPATLKRPPELL